MGKIIKITGLLLGIFFLSVILVNILMHPGNGGGVQGKKCGDIIRWKTDTGNRLCETGNGWCKEGGLSDAADYYSTIQTYAVV